jgi:membrane-associated HD superfamily phosphohydrolase
VGKLFGQFFELLFAIIGFATFSTWKKSPLLMALVFMLSLYYLALVLLTMLQLQNKSFLPFIMVILLLGSVVSFLALMMISPTIAWVDFSLWIFIFALVGYKNREEIYQMINLPFIDGESVNDNGMSKHNSEIPGIESLPV